ncbi:MAG: glycosyltransferase family 2 protein, partial [Luteolibacter sp.]
YFRRLHHVAGNRPLVISEFGLDTRRNGLQRQAELMGAALELAQEIGCAGFTAYAWSDQWWNREAEVHDWNFGLIDRQGNEKPALQVLRSVPPMRLLPGPRFSVIVCSRNGAPRILSCLDAIRALHGDFELIVVDDGSTDGTGDLVAATYPDAILLRIGASGLSAARNAGAALASGELLVFTDDDCEPDCEWLLRMGKAFAAGSHDALGGPNIPPRPSNWHQAVTDAAPGAPGHVMLNDVDAEHLPGCNLAVTRRAFDAVGGFDPIFHTAGDDVDFCWRLEDAGFRIGFVPDAFVWHHRRRTIRGYLRQQWGYGVAERALIRKHPQRFTNEGRAEWKGCIYDGRARRVQSGDVIYHGLMGNAPYQKLGWIDAAAPQLSPSFDSPRARVVLMLTSLLARILREWARTRRVRMFVEFGVKPFDTSNTVEECLIPGIERDAVLECLLRRGWIPCGDEESWDLVWKDLKLVTATERDAKGFPSTWIRVAAPELDSRLFEQIVSTIASQRGDWKCDANE